MNKEEKLKKLRAAFGITETESWDPETFLLKLGLTMRENTVAVRTAIESLNKNSMEKDDLVNAITKIGQLSQNIEQMTELEKQVVQAVKDHRIERVEVEHIREIPPSKIKVEVDQKDGPMPEAHQSFFRKMFESIKSPINPLIEWFDAALSAIRTPEGAIAVKLVDRENRGFYNAIFSAVAGGTTISTSSLLQDPTFTGRIGEVQASPTANTVLDRLKQLLTGIVLAAGSNNIGSVTDAGSGKTLKTFSGTCSSSGNNTIISAVTSKRLKVYSLVLSYIGTTAVVAYFRDGTGGSELRRYDFQTPASVSTGANDSVNPPSFLLATTAGNELDLNLSAAQAIHYAGSYFDDDAT